MARLCANPAIPVALDEELIGIFEREEKRKLLQAIKPAYVIDINRDIQLRAS